MKFCTYTESADWCAAHGYPTEQIPGDIVGPDPNLTEPDFAFESFKIHEDAGQRVYLARALFTHFDKDADLFIQIGNWCVWPSSQHMPLFTRFRAAFGEHRHPIEAPGHIIPPEEREDALSIAIVALLYLWDCHVLSSKGDQALFLCHDEWGHFAVRPPRTLPPSLTNPDFDDANPPPS